METLSVIVVDDHRLFREGMNLLLSNLPFISGVREAADGEEFLAILEEEIPDIVFMDLDMPGMGGIEAGRRALERIPTLNIIALSMHGDEDYYMRMIEAGARGFILKNSGIGEVENAIRMVAGGSSYFSKEILEGFLKSLSRKKQIPGDDSLSDREIEVLYQICNGHSNKQIADRLCISKRTVDKHRENLLLKTGAGNTAGLVMYAIRKGYVEV